MKNIKGSLINLEISNEEYKGQPDKFRKEKE